MGWIGIVGPKDAGASERERMRAIAQTAFDEAGVESPTRIDVPAKGSGTSDEGASLRDEVMAIVPALQSGSLFGGATGVFVMDSQNLLKVELDAIVEMLANADPDQAVAVFAASGTLPAPLKKAIAASGEVVSFKALSARDAHQWIGEYARSNGLRIDAEARRARQALRSKPGGDASSNRSACRFGWGD